MRDSLYENVPYALSELKHFYGDNVHLVGSPYLLSLLATLYPSWRAARTDPVVALRNE